MSKAKNRGIRSWLFNRSSSGNFTSIINHPQRVPALPRRTESKTEFELTSLRIHQLLEKKKYLKVVDLLRELQPEYLLKCLESFPFQTLNKAVPDSFPIWETLLTRLHNGKEGYIPQFPYAACDELVIRVALLLYFLEKEVSRDHGHLLIQCRRVLKKVYMQYHDILPHLLEENERLSQTLYSMGIHIPLGTDALAISLHQAIKDEVAASLVDFQDATEHLNDLSGSEMLLSDSPPSGVLPSGRLEMNGMSVGRENSVHQVTQLQVQERLYFNQCVLRTITPCRRRGNLAELLDMMNQRIHKDKELLVIYASLRQRNNFITDSEPVEPWLRHYQHSIECAIAVLKEIEEELAIKSPAVSPPLVKMECRSITPEYRMHLGAPSLVIRSESSISLDQDDLTALLDGASHMVENHPGMSRKRSASVYHPRRPSSATLDSTSGRTGSSLSINGLSGNVFQTTLMAGTSASAQDLTLSSSPPSFAHFQGPVTANLQITRVTSKKKPFIANPIRRSLRSLSGSTSSMTQKLKKKRGMSRTGSNGLDVENNSGGSLETTKKELLEARELIQKLRKRERELTDRLSEQAQRHLQDSDKFEDILMGASRPSLVVQRYQELFSQSRVEAFEAIELLDELEDDQFVSEILLDILKSTYAASQLQLESLHKKWKKSLGANMEHNMDSRQLSALKQLGSAVSLFLRKVSSSFSSEEIVSTARWELERHHGCLPLFSKIMQLEPVISYLHDCAHLSWDLVVQTPPMVINYQEVEFIPELHSRFYSANKESNQILTYLWPTLVQLSSGSVLFKGTVIT